MIQTWGDWDLFQILLQTLQAIAAKHNVCNSNVATRWMLDFQYVGAVIIGARMGVSEHTEEKLRHTDRRLTMRIKGASRKFLRRTGGKRYFKSWAIAAVSIGNGLAKHNCSRVSRIVD
jgi:aryl-alcohol dehydrogenase-like predicted oxidoreductase